MRPVALACVVVALLAGCASSDPAAPAGEEAPSPDGGARIEGQTRTSGYLQVRDGTLLAYDLVLPGDGSGRYPTLFEYSGYAPGEAVDAGYAERFVPKGYALIGVNVRGTGCSGGAFDLFEPVQALDGYDAIEWMAAQPWSDGKVGMIGKSYPGITQLFVAAQRPPHLVAAAPGHVFGDIYRDVAYPGGIFNYAFVGLWSFVAQPLPGLQAAGASVAGERDATCARHVAERAPDNAREHAFLQAAQHRFDDELIRERSPLYVADKIQVPLYLQQSWQDEQVGVRGVDVVERLRSPWWLTLSNGDHAMYRDEGSLARLERVLDRYLKGVDNGWDAEPRVTVGFDAGQTGSREPAWTRTYDAWPLPEAAVEALTLHLREGGALTTEPPGAGEPGDRYVHPGGSTSNGAGYGYVPGPPTDRVAPPAPLVVAYTTAPLAEDVVVLGTGNFTFWASSTAADTDFEVRLSEVRPDGKVVHVQKGWLRASHRALDPDRSGPFKPVHLHASEALLTPGEPVELSIELLAMGHAFRAGSAIRVEVSSPGTLPELWAFVTVPVPAVNEVLHDAQRPSRLVLPVLPGERADTPLPACGSLIRQSCR